MMKNDNYLLVDPIGSSSLLLTLKILIRLD